MKAKDVQRQAAARSRWGSAQAEVRAFSHVVMVDSCWEWVGALSSDGYGRFHDGLRMVQAHRFMYEARRGPIGGGLSLDHLCRNRRCVNPDHLEIVTHRENCLRGESPSALVVRTNTCANGHAMVGWNVRVETNGKRRCRTCHNRRERENKARRREARP